MTFVRARGVTVKAQARAQGPAVLAIGKHNACGASSQACAQKTRDFSNQEVVVLIELDKVAICGTVGCLGGEDHCDALAASKASHFRPRPVAAEPVRDRPHKDRPLSTLAPCTQSKSDHSHSFAT